LSSNYSAFKRPNNSAQFLLDLAMFGLRDILFMLFGAILGFGVDRIKAMLDRRLALAPSAPGEG
jgi:hypothetical protein